MLIVLCEYHCEKRWISDCLHCKWKWLLLLILLLLMLPLNASMYDHVHWLWPLWWHIVWRFRNTYKEHTQQSNNNSQSKLNTECKNHLPDCKYYRICCILHSEMYPETSNEIFNMRFSKFWSYRVMDVKAHLCQLESLVPPPSMMPLLSAFLIGPCWAYHSVGLGTLC